MDAGAEIDLYLGWTLCESLVDLSGLVDGRRCRECFQGIMHVFRPSSEDIVRSIEVGI